MKTWPQRVRYFGTGTQCSAVTRMLQRMRVSPLRHLKLETCPAPYQPLRLRFSHLPE
jgi:hypothetical protein